MKTSFQFGDFWIKINETREVIQATVHDLKSDEQLGAGQGRTVELAVGTAVLAAAEMLQMRQR
jgi:hypothetical protein